MNVRLLEIELFAIVCFTIVCINGAGWILYKLMKLTSWEDGIKSLFHYLHIWLYENITGKYFIPPEDEIDERIYLSSEELVEFSQELEMVYDNPYLKEGVTYTNDAAWFDYSVYGINPKYKDLSLGEKKRLIKSVVRKYYQRIRGTLELPVYIKVCSNYRLYFAIPLSAKGNSYLQNQEQFNDMSETTFSTQHSAKIIEEEIPQDSDYEVRL